MPELAPVITITCSASGFSLIGMFFSRFHRQQGRRAAVPMLDSGRAVGKARHVARGWTWLIALALALLPGVAPAGPREQPARHLTDPPLADRMTERELAAAADVGFTIERDRSPRALLEQQGRLSAALAAVGPQRPGTVDAYVVVAALDSDPVFAREAREAGRVLARRYGAQGRTIVLAGPDGRDGAPLPMGSPDAIAAALARVRERMDPREDVLVLYTTSHGAPWGIVYDDGDQGYGAISPTRLWSMLGSLGITNRLLMVSACFSGQFVPMLQSPTTAIITASSADRTSFGCQSDNDWTFFGDALINHALRRAQPLGPAAKEATGLIGGWEQQGKVIPSQPQVSIGTRVARWLAPLEAALPPATSPVGKPATGALARAAAAHH
jgi:hypothetical protein